MKRLNNVLHKDHSFGGCTGHPYTANLSPMTTNATRWRLFSLRISLDEHLGCDGRTESQWPNQLADTVEDTGRGGVSVPSASQQRNSSSTVASLLPVVC